MLISSSQYFVLWLWRTVRGRYFPLLLCATTSSSWGAMLHTTNAQFEIGEVTLSKGWWWCGVCVCITQFYTYRVIHLLRFTRVVCTVYHSNMHRTRALQTQ